MKIYMDVCCWNRPLDDLSQSRVSFESQAVLSILAHCKKAGWEIAGSSVIDAELAKCKNVEKLQKVRALYSVAKNRLIVTNDVETRALVLQAGGIKAYDSLHLSLAEIHGQDVFLTTDDAFFAAARRVESTVKVMNPVMFFMEAIKHGN